jgi:hypothetical protein
MRFDTTDAALLFARFIALVRDFSGHSFAPEFMMHF